MPHTREYRGRILPLQTPQAFTNRAYRFRIPNQIPASNPKHGSETFKEEILKNLSKENAKTTEGLSTLDQFQVDKVKKANQGKFKENSRYVVQDKDSPETRPPSKKRKVHFDDDAESEPKQEESKTKRPRTNDLSPRSIYDDPNEDAYLDSAGFYDGVPDTAGIWDDQEQDGCRIDTAGPQEDQNQEILVPLFASIYDQGLALVVDEDFTSPWAVIQARRNGSQHTKDIHVYWYSQHVPRHVGLDGNEVEDVVDGASWADIMATEPFPGDNQFTWQYDSINDLAAASSQKSLPNTADSSFDVPTHEDHQSLPEQTPNDPQMTPFPSWQTPLSAVNQIGRYQIPSDTFEEVWRDHHGSTGF